MIESGWLPTDQLAEAVIELANKLRDAVFAIDAPRMALLKPRTWYWRKNRWSSQTGTEKGHGRHCEVVVAAHRLANPQWTPMATARPPG